MINVLLIEDNPIDARLMQRMLAQIRGWPTQVTWVDDGQKALWYLQSLDAGGVEDPPALVLLDLNLPKYDGLQVLEAFRNSAKACKLPVFLFSCSRAEEIEAIATRRRLSADAYFEKPYSLEAFEALATNIRGSFENLRRQAAALPFAPAILEARRADAPEQTRSAHR